MFRKSRFALLVCAAGVLGATPPAPEVSRAQAAIARLPLRFEANQGQWNSRVHYAARAGGYTVAVTAKGPSVSFADSKRLDIGLMNANRAAAIEPLERVPVRTDYFVGSRQNWKSEVPSYARVRYRDVYPGVDLVLYGNGSQLEYDFVLAPGADPRTVWLKFDGASHVSLTPDGDLQIDAGGSRIVQKKPVIYQEDPAGARHEIAGAYELLSHNRASIRVARYDRTRPLVIDPVLTYASYIGGSETDQVTAVTLDNKGRLYVAGWTNNGDIGATDGAYRNANAGFSDGFVAILDATPAGDFALKMLTYLGGAGIDLPTAITADSAGFVYITGTTTSTNYPVAGQAVQPTGAGTSVEAFVTELNTNATGTDALWYSTYLGGSAGDQKPHGIAVDNKGFIYVIGETRATDFPVTASAYQSVTWGPQDMFLSKIDITSTSLVYSTYLGGELAEEGRAIAVAPNGLVYFAGSTYSTTFPFAGSPLHPTPVGNFDIIIGVMDMTKSGVNSLVYCTYFGGSDNDEVRGIAIDPKGNLLLTGYTMSGDFPVTPDAMQHSYGGNADAFVSVVNPLDPKNFVVYSTYLGGTDGDVAYGVGSDSAGNLYVTGYTISSDFPVQNALQGSWGGGIDLFLTKFKPGVTGSPAMVYSTYLGGAAQYVPLGMTVGADGTAYVAGYAGTGLSTTDNALQAFRGGQSDGFILAVKDTPSASERVRSTALREYRR
ncbi:MAG TPA: SBBP repeat-containing protein [Bryobacteraceae bacterium]